jgi:cell division protein FtsW
MGTTVLLTAVALGLLFLAGTRPLYIGIGLGIGAVFFIYSMLHSEYRRRRVMAFLNPWADPTGDGFQTIQSFLSIHSGKIFGVGLGNGNSKLFFLPEVHTDFIFSLVGEELGFVGAVILCFALSTSSTSYSKPQFRRKNRLAVTSLSAWHFP